MMQPRSRRIGRDKLASLSGGDHEIIKFLEGTQIDASDAVGGANDAASAAKAAQDSADQAQQSANTAQSSANQASQDAAAAQADANTAQAAADQASVDAGTAQSTANSALQLAQNIDADYISRSNPSGQSVVSTFQAASYRILGVQVVGMRIFGITAATGNPYYGAFNGSTTYSVSAAYTQSEVVAIANALSQARERIIALEKAMRDHGLIA